MKHFLTLSLIDLLILIFIPACNLTADVATPTPFDLDTVQTAVAATLAAQPSATNTAEPTATTPPTPIPSPTTPITYANAAGAQRIQFVTGGTWAEVTANGQANQPTQFVLGAMKNQVMSVSVFQNWGYPVEVKGQDGILLSIKDSDDAFWRGTLPVTQDYFITITPQLDGPFTLRVAINPPGQAEQTFQYNSAQFPVSLSYSDSFAPVNFPYGDQLRAAPALALNFIDSTFYNQTNLSEAYFVLGVYTDPALVATCNQPYFSQEESRGQETINGLTYDKSFGGGAGAGNYYIQTAYRTVQKNACLEIVFFVHYTNAGNYVPGTVTEYDDAALTQKFMDVLKTVSVK